MELISELTQWQDCIQSLKQLFVDFSKIVDEPIGKYNTESWAEFDHIRSEIALYTPLSDIELTDLFMGSDVNSMIYNLDRGSSITHLFIIVRQKFLSMSIIVLASKTKSMTFEKNLTKIHDDMISETDELCDKYHHLKETIRRFAYKEIHISFFTLETFPQYELSMILIIWLSKRVKDYNTIELIKQASLGVADNKVIDDSDQHMIQRLNFIDAIGPQLYTRKISGGGSLYDLYLRKVGDGCGDSSGDRDGRGDSSGGRGDENLYDLYLRKVGGGIPRDISSTDIVISDDKIIDIRIFGYSTIYRLDVILSEIINPMRGVTMVTVKKLNTISCKKYETASDGKRSQEHDTASDGKRSQEHETASDGKRSQEHETASDERRVISDGILYLSDNMKEFFKVRGPHGWKFLNGINPTMKLYSERANNVIAKQKKELVEYDTSLFESIFNFSTSLLTKKMIDHIKEAIATAKIESYDDLMQLVLPEPDDSMNSYMTKIVYELLTTNLSERLKQYMKTPEQFTTLLKEVSLSFLCQSMKFSTNLVLTIREHLATEFFDKDLFDMNTEEKHINRNIAILEWYERLFIPTVERRAKSMPEILTKFIQLKDLVVKI
jgi:hypothetical protein